MSTILVSCVGGRPLPNILCVFELKPDKLYLISSKDSTGENGSQSKLLAALPERIKIGTESCYPVAPYVPSEAEKACRKIFEENPGHKFIFNLASETTPMALGVYKFAHDMRAEGHDVELKYSSRDGLVDIFGDARTPKPLDISIKDYFSVYGWDVTMKKEDSLYRETAHLLVDSLPTSHNLLKVMRRNYKGKEGEKKTIRIDISNAKNRLNDDEIQLLYQFEKMGLIHNVQQGEGKVSYTIIEQRYWDLLAGDWLEYYVFDVAETLTGRGFDECAWSVEDRSAGRKDGRGELDFVGAYQGQFIIASCKTEDKVESEHLNELSTRGDQLGQGMCTKIFVTSAFLLPDQKEEAERRARDRGITCITGEELLKLAESLIKAIGDRSRL